MKLRSGDRIQNKRAMTLIELLVVAAILGILVAVALPNFLNASLRAKVSRARSDIRSLAFAEETYALDNDGGYPPDGYSSRPNHLYWLTSPVPYMASIPLDPFLPRDWEYTRLYLSDSASFQRRKYQAYVLFSAGPDQGFVIVYRSGWSISPCFGKQPYITYDPTNGTRSGGDIYWYGGNPSGIPLWVDGETLEGRFPPNFGG